MIGIEGEVRQRPDINWARMKQEPKTGEAITHALPVEMTVGVGLVTSEQG